MIYHIVVGKGCTDALQSAMERQEDMKGQIVVIEDLLHIGPLQQTPGMSFDIFRQQYWQNLMHTEDKSLPFNCDPLKQILDVSNELNKYPNRFAWIWVAPRAADVCAYYFALFHLRKHLERLRVINIAGLPFLDNDGKLYYPTQLSQLPSKEIIKARKLARTITASEMELDIEEWYRLASQEKGIRKQEGGKKISYQPETLFDYLIKSFCSNQFAKASRIVQQSLNKGLVEANELFVAHRLFQLAEQEEVVLKGDISKGIKEWDIKLPSGELFADDTLETTTDNDHEQP